MYFSISFLLSKHYRIKEQPVLIRERQLEQILKGKDQFVAFTEQVWALSAGRGRWCQPPKFSFLLFFLWKTGQMERTRSYFVRMSFKRLKCHFWEEVRLLSLPAVGWTKQP